jgi:hypothetical protein
VTDNGASATQKWAFTTGGPIYSAPAISADGTVYIGSSGGYLYANEHKRKLRRDSPLKEKEGQLSARAEEVGSNGRLSTARYE